MNPRIFLLILGIALIALAATGGALGYNRLQNLADRSEDVEDLVTRARLLVEHGAPQEEITAVLDRAEMHANRTGRRAAASSQDLLKAFWITGPSLVATLGVLLIVLVFRPLGRAGRATTPAAAAAAVSGVSGSLAELLRDLDDERRQRLLDLVRAGHLAALGTLAAGIAHEVRNPLMTISVLAEGAVERLNGNPEHESLRERLQQIEDESRRAGGLLGDLLNMAPSDVSSPERFELGEEIREAYRLLSRRDQQAVIQVEASSQAWIVGIPARWRQILINLIRNGLDATDGSGPVRVTLDREEHHAVVRVADEGHGFDAETAPRLFEPFFSTKRRHVEREGGYGLGLFVAESLVRDADGELRAHSDGPGRGAVFEVRVPLAEVKL